MYYFRSVSSTALLTVLHFLVDALCACCVFLLLPGLGWQQSACLLLVYNGMAFLTQPLVGWWLDCRQRSFLHSLLAAVALLVTGVGLSAANGLSCALVIGAGNSLFHVCAGRRVTLETGGDMRHLGVMVSSGAIGLAVGGLMATPLGLAVLIGLLICLTACCVSLTPRIPVLRQKADDVSCTLLAFVLLLVFMRSFIGKAAPVTLDGMEVNPLSVALLSAAGKAVGGFVGHWFGVWRTLMLSLLFTALLFLGSASSLTALCGLFFLLNLSMPLTLHLANRSLPGYPGLAFGAAAAVLVPGYALGLWCQGNPLADRLLPPLLLTLAIEAVVLYVLRERRWSVFAVFVVMNILTNVPLNYYVFRVLNDQPTPIQVAMLELVVVALETLFYLIATRNLCRSLFYSIVCNVVSFSVGVLLTNYV